MNKFIKIIKNPYMGFDFILRRLSPYIKNDKIYVKLHYFFCMHKRLNLNNPQTFNEKLSWLKINDIHPEYSKLVDKYEVKKYVADKIGEKYIIPTLGIYQQFEDIDFKELPNRFVIKCTHDSQSTIIVKDKNTFDVNKAHQKLNKALKRNWYWPTREYPYKNVEPRIIVEKYMEEESSNSLKDYKFFCFNGVPKMMFIATGRPINTCFDFYDMDFNHIDLRQGHPNANQTIEKPKGWEKMKELASILSQNFPQVRVDFYDINNNIYFGELTFFHFGGDTNFDPAEWDKIMGDWIVLPKK